MHRSPYTPASAAECFSCSQTLYMHNADDDDTAPEEHRQQLFIASAEMAALRTAKNGTRVWSSGQIPYKNNSAVTRKQTLKQHHVSHDAMTSSHCHSVSVEISTVGDAYS